MRQKIIAFVCLIASGVQAEPQTKDEQELIAQGVRASFHGSSELPDGIAFQEFLRIIAAGDWPAYELVASALGIQLTDDSLPEIRQRTEYFRDINRSLRIEKNATAFAMLCPENRADRTNEDVYDVMNDVDDVQEVIAEKHYLVAISSISVEERRTLQKYLNELKAGITYVKVDDSARIEEQNLDVRIGMEQYCANLESTVSGVQR
jgi:hypothetical protein